MIIKTLIINLLRNKTLSAIQIGGLVIGFSIFIFLLVKLSYEYSYDNFWKNRQSIYRIGLNLAYEDGRVVNSAKNFPGSGELLKAEVPGVVAQCNITRDIINVYYQENVIQNVDWFWSDTSFFNVFERKFIYQESDQLWGDLHTIVISESFARKLFGNEDPLNKEISLNEGWKFLVKGVFEDIPSNSHLKVDVLGSYRTLNYYMRNYDPDAQVLIENPDFVYQRPTPYSRRRWRSPLQYRPYCYLRLEANKNIDQLEEAVQPSLMKVGLPDNLKNCKINFVIQPISSIHLNSKLDNDLSANGNSTQVKFLIMIAIIVLIVSIVNHLNLVTISSIEDRKSYSIRLLNGARRISIFKTLLIRNLILFLLALTIALPIAYLIIQWKLPVKSFPKSLPAIISVIVILGSFFLALVPYLSIFNSAIFSSLKGHTQRINQKWSSRKALIVLQFTISIILIISTVGIFKQMNYITNEKLGFTGSQRVFCHTPMTISNHPDIPAKLLTFRNEVHTLPGVRSFSVSSSVPGKDIRRWNENVMPENSAEPFETSFSIVSIDDKFLDTYDISLLAGKNLDERLNWSSDEVLINQYASEIMGYKNPANAIGSTFTIGNNSYRVKGVIKNYHHFSLHQEIKPALYLQNLQWEMSVGYYSFEIASSDISEVMISVEKIWNRLYPGDEFVYHFSDKEFELQYKSDVAFNRVLSYSALLSLIISCLGLFSLAIFNAKQRIKEIGIRKVNGAKTVEVISILNIDFLKWVIIAFIIATPIAWYAMNKWLENFAYKTNISWWIFALAGLLALGVAILTVSWQSWKAASKNPVEALRYE